MKKLQNLFLSTFLRTYLRKVCEYVPKLDKKTYSRVKAKELTMRKCKLQV